MKNRILVGVTLSLCLGLVGPAKPISETTAEVGSAAGGVALGAFVGGVTYLALDANRDLRNNGGTKILISTFAGLGSGVIFWWALRNHLYTFTPREKLRKAERIISTIEMDSLIARNFQTEEEIVRCINARFSSSWPLISSRTQFTNFIGGLNVARDVLVNARREMRADSSRYPGLLKQCDELLAKVPAIARLIEDRLSIITDHKDFNVQLKLFRKHEEAERQRQHEYGLQSNLLSHDSWEKTKDRWHDSSEKNQDRQQKQNIVNTHPLQGINVTI